MEEFLTIQKEVKALQYANGEWKVVDEKGNVETIPDEAFKAKYIAKPKAKVAAKPEEAKK